MGALSFGSDWVVGASGVYTELNERFRQIGALSGCVDAGVITGNLITTPPETVPEDDTVYIIDGTKHTCTAVALVTGGANFTLSTSISADIDVGDYFLFKPTTAYVSACAQDFESILGFYTISAINDTRKIITVSNSDLLATYASTSGYVFTSYGEFNPYTEFIAHYYDSQYHFYAPTKGLTMMCNNVTDTVLASRTYKPFIGNIAQSTFWMA